MLHTFAKPSNLWKKQQRKHCNLLQILVDVEMVFIPEAI
jgi:hypothetical protein